MYNVLFRSENILSEAAEEGWTNNAFLAAPAQYGSIYSVVRCLCWIKGPIVPLLCQIMPYAMVNRFCQNLCWHNLPIPIPDPSRQVMNIPSQSVSPSISIHLHLSLSQFSSQSVHLLALHLHLFKSISRFF